MAGGEIEALRRFAGAGARLVSVRPRLGGGRALVRVDMPTPELAAWARGVVAAAGFEVGGNDTPWERQVVFSVPAGALDDVYPGWRQTSARVGVGPARPALPEQEERRTWRAWDDERIRGVRILDPDGFRGEPEGRLYTREEFLLLRVRCSVTTKL